MSGAYYNEIDLHAAAWLRELIRRGLIADGEVDTRSIEDVRPINPSASTEGRVMRLRGYGNAIVPQVAAEFVAAYLDARAVA